jgi:hypothetical protein
MDSRPKKLLDQVRETIQLKHYSSRTEETYIDWIKRYPRPQPRRPGRAQPAGLDVPPQGF